jgi:hypothetical protein
MSNPIKYTTGTETLALKKGNFYIGTGDVGKGPSDTTGYYQGPNVPSGGYVIYLNKEGAPGGLSYHSAANDAQLISFTNNLAGQSYTTVNECLVYFASQTDKVVLNRDYEGIVTDGLILNVDAGFTPSYPRSGTTWTDLSLSGNNGTLINSPTFSTDGGGCIVFDGIDDRATFPTSSDFAFGSGNLSIEVWYKRINRFDPYPRICQFGTGWNNNQCWAFLDGHQVWGSTKFSVHIFAQNGNTSNLLTSNTTVSSDTWYYLVLTRNSSLWTLYVNSSVDKTATWAGQPDNGISNIFQIAGAAYNDDDFSNSKITNLRLYKRALTSDEILQNYNTQKGRFGL